MKKRSLVPEDLRQLETLSRGQYNRERSMFIYASSCKGRSDEIRLINLEDDSETVLVIGGNTPHLSPDGKLLCYLSDGQLWIYDHTTGQNRRLTTMRHLVSDPCWSPRGDMICFTSPCAGDTDLHWLQSLPEEESAAAEREYRADEPVVIEDFGYKFDGMGYHRPERKHLWVVSADGGEAQRLTEGDFDHVLPAWAPDGNRIVFISSRCRDKKDTLANDLFSVSPLGGDIVRLTSSGWFAVYPTPFRPLFTPDGKYIVAGMFEDEDLKTGNGIPFAFLHRISADGSEDISIFPKDAPCHECVQFPYNPGIASCYDSARISSDGRSVLFCSGAEGASNIYRAEIYNNPEIVNVTDEKWSIAGLDKPQGGYFAAPLGNSDRPGDYWLISEAAGKPVRQLTHSNRWIDEVMLGEAEELWIECLDGGGRVHGWVLPPANAEPGKKYPAVLYIHGGPHPFYTYGFDFEHQMFAGAGIAVLYCNPRGSSSYGRNHENMTRAYDGSAYTDLLQFVDEACRKFDFIDTKRIGAAGGSYGGYMVNYMAVHSSRFRAYITQRSISNKQISYASSDMQGDSSKYKSFEEFMVNNVKESAVSYAENLQAPILILHGMDDLRCPVEHAHQLFTAFRDVHPEIPVKMILYPGCAHSQPKEFSSLMHYYQAMVDWLTEYLQGDNYHENSSGR